MGRDAVCTQGAKVSQHGRASRGTGPAPPQNKCISRFVCELHRRMSGTARPTPRTEGAYCRTSQNSRELQCASCSVRV